MSLLTEADMSLWHLSILEKPHICKIRRVSKPASCGSALPKHGTKDSCTAFCPRPILVSPEHQRQWKELHKALVLAITDIVERWWKDPAAHLPERMPLEPQEEDLLKWIDSQVPDMLPPYWECRGSWRPDFLVEVDNSATSEMTERFRISEIDARFSVNGLMYVAYGQQALHDVGTSGGGNGLKGAINPAKMVGGLLDLFRPDVPLHLPKGDEADIDIHMFVDFLERHLGITPRFVKPSDLRLLPDPQQKSGYKLCCVAKGLDGSYPSATLIHTGDEVLEEIHQVGLEVHQRELHGLQPEMLRQVSLCCFNDMRTILLVHDKRMLGIVKQKLKSLVARGIITPAQSYALNHDIADTILPGSLELDQFIGHCKELPGRRNRYFLKPIQSGKGDGIVFSDGLSSAEWLSGLYLLRTSWFLTGGGTCIVQRKVKHLLYDVVLRPSGVKDKYPLLGTFHSVNGQFLGLSVWRSSRDRICAISHGDTWTCSVMRG
ncbi:hypothetical protein BBP40_011049 [Aspergillus hancockii]|nr:hypothetical protein BBP40_011049 [Aspergillus hancockii]